MRHVRYMTALIAVMMVGILAGRAQAGITNSAHDFGKLGPTGWAKGDTCLPCHTPHGAQVRDAQGVLVGAPLWNHQISVATYTLYVDPETGQNVTGDVDTNSRLCLSCHDGTVAVDSFGGMTGTQQLTGGLIGTDLSNDHPIGEHAIWPAQTPSYMVEPSLRDALHTMPLRPMADGQLAVGCTTCHEPHNRRNTEHMLWFANNIPGTTVDGRVVNGSLLCMNCHKK